MHICHNVRLMVTYIVHGAPNQGSFFNPGLWCIFPRDWRTGLEPPDDLAVSKMILPCLRDLSLLLDLVQLLHPTRLLCYRCTQICCIAAPFGAEDWTRAAGRNLIASSAKTGIRTPHYPDSPASKTMSISDETLLVSYTMIALSQYKYSQ